MNEFVKELLSEKIKEKIPTSLVQKLQSFQENERQYWYFGALVNQKQYELDCLELRMWRAFYPLHNIISKEKNENVLNEYKKQQFIYFRAMCCDALDICNELFSHKNV